MCVRFAAIFLCGVCGCPYNDFVICKDSSDCLIPNKLTSTHTNLPWFNRGLILKAKAYVQG